MSTYAAPLRDMTFVLNQLAGIREVATLPGYEDATPATADAILEEAAKFAAGILDPLNRSGDREGARWCDGEVTTPTGFKEAYRQFVAAGWNALPFAPEWGGQGLPKLVAAAVEEMWGSANLSFALCPMLSQGALHAVESRGSQALKTAYIPKLVSGEWTGTMNLTEPQAGSDLALVRTRAEPRDDHYRIFGQKIFITYGEHDLAENIVHLVLARMPSAPEGVKGISLFLVPKFLLNDDGTPGSRNDLRCASIEHKLGIHASPTSVMVFGDAGDGAVGYLVGEENRGLEAMFVMMNDARFAVGLQGLSIAERSYQRALAYARERLQGRGAVAGGGAVPIIRHPDVRRMLMLMKSQTEAMRALAYVTAAAQDAALRHPDATVRRDNQAFVDLMIPVVKGCSTETAIDIASLGVQVHGGMGFIEETGAAQYYRDARITTIYEGTTGIQANDLVGRKIARDSGVAVKAYIARLCQFDSELARSRNPDIRAVRRALAEGVGGVSDCVDFILDTVGKSANAAYAGAVPFLKLMGIVAGGWQMARAALAAERELETGRNTDNLFHQAKIATARFYGDHVLSQATGLAATVANGSASVLAMADEHFI
jgi:alkylation response protein AidB-like acyl-CoA dehydrogenase